jgi:hypothetical protein
MRKVFFGKRGLNVAFIGAIDFLGYGVVGDFGNV